MSMPRCGCIAHLLHATRVRIDETLLEVVFLCRSCGKVVARRDHNVFGAIRRIAPKSN